MIPFEHEYLIEYRYLHFPIRTGAQKIPMQLVFAGQVAREFTVELAVDGPRQWWANYDVNALRGKTVRLRTCESCLTKAQAALLGQLITQSDGLLATQDLYQERYRPQLHFTPRRGWSNDPNGLVFQDGIWHLFFQHNPLGIDWGAMHWGHATSRDLLHWEEQPIALFPRSLTDMAYSGGAVVDTGNTSGFGIALEEPLVLSFTSTGRGECLAYSLDGGKNFQEYNGNPVIRHAGRDPKIIWYAARQKWVMIVYEEGEGKRGYDLYDSTNLKQWRWMQHLPGWFECPELFDLPLEGGNPRERRWVVYGSIYEQMRSAFQLGEFDGERFIPEGDPQAGHAGPHFYAAQVFSHAPDGRRIMLGWLAGAAYPDMPFGHGMSLPLELSLRQAGDQTRVCFYPVREIDLLRVATELGENLTIPQANELISGLKSEFLDIEVEIEPQGLGPVRLDIGGYPVVYDPGSFWVTFAKRSVTRQPGDTPIHLRVIVDRSVTEVFVDRGWGALAAMTIFKDPECRVCLEGEANVRFIKAHKLRSIWES